MLPVYWEIRCNYLVEGTSALGACVSNFACINYIFYCPLAYNKECMYSYVTRELISPRLMQSFLYLERTSVGIQHYLSSRDVMTASFDFLTCGLFALCGANLIILMASQIHILSQNN